jgi:AbrB family looped-hinge helix DNA binding protein
MSATAPALPVKKQIAKVTSKGQITIPAEMRELLGVQPGDKLVFERQPNGEIFVRKADEFPFNRFRGMGTGIPELDNGSIEDIVQWFREARGHDEVDDRLLGTSRFGKSE